MIMPKMILFDYGQTLIEEQKFDGVKGTEAVLKYATKNKFHLSAERIQHEADMVKRELGRVSPERRHLVQIEVPNSMFTPYIYESQGIEIPLSNEEIDEIFWDAAAKGTPTEGMEDFLSLLSKLKIRTGVISNISYAPKVVANRINKLLPNNEFEFILTSSNYIFRKPHHRIFELALAKADLKPEEVWYIGDQYECDIRGASEVGILPIWYIAYIDMDYTPHDDVLTIHSWDELRNILMGMKKD